jgi:hypothetical protein
VNLGSSWKEALLMSVLSVSYSSMTYNPLMVWEGSATLEWFPYCPYSPY